MPTGRSGRCSWNIETRERLEIDDQLARYTAAADHGARTATWGDKQGNQAVFSGMSRRISAGTAQEASTASEPFLEAIHGNAPGTMLSQA